MDIKRGSVTPVDLTGQADGDYIRNDAGVYKPKTPDDVIQDLISVNGQWSTFSPDDLFRQATTNTGAVLRYPRYNRLTTGTTANSTVRINGTYFNAWTPGNNHAVMSYNNPILFRTVCAFVMNAATAPNGKAWGVFGVERDAAIADPTVKSIGFRVDAYALKGIVHNGAGLTVVDLSTTLTANIAYIIDIYSDGSGNVYWYLNNVLKGSTALGPTGNATSLQECLQYMIINVEAVAHTGQIYAVAIYTGG